MNGNFRVTLAGALLLAAFSTTANAQPLPANLQAGEAVLANSDTSASPNEMFDYCAKKNIPLKPIGKLTGKNDFCVIAYTAYITGNAITKVGYSTKDTVSQIAQDFGMSYQRAGLGEILLPFSCLATFREGQDFFINNGMMHSSDRAKFEKINELEANSKILQNSQSYCSQKIRKSIFG